MAHALVFDSGVGGLSVVEELRKIAPDLYLSYVADDEFRPYGDKTEAQLKSRLPGLLQTLCLMLKPDIIVMACNTASTTALAEIRDAVSVPVVGVVPAIKPAAEQSQTKTIAVLGTPGTVRRRYVDQLIADFASGCDVRLHGSTELVNLAEQKLSGTEIMIASVQSEIAPLFAGKTGASLDTIVLACTHFPLLQNELAAASPKNVTWIDSGNAIARRTLSILQGLKHTKIPSHPATAFLIGGQANFEREVMFKTFGFEKVVTLKA
ncbi:MAG: glutamate racemase [Acidimicrobiales bacterium]|nr:glutamate racemase [Hyphomonadaceae bacterium]RZV42975.1 MAG: glutamate racemase [Acidimicrobiales bacterium]